MNDVQINLNVHEIGIILEALNNLEQTDKNLISKEYGPSPVLYDKLYSVWKTMDHTQLNLKYDFEPSF